jgi:hypothetical protein
MKTILTTISFTLLSVAVCGQTTATDYMKQAPAIPESVCGCDEQAKTQFLNSVSQLSQEVTADVQENNRQIEEHMQSYEGEMKKNMLKNSGITDDEIRKMQSKKGMTQAEKNEMINRVMQQSANISLDEAKNMKNMSKEAREAWAKGYAAEQQAMAQVNPSSSANISNLDPKTISSLMSEQSELRAKLTALESDLQQKLAVIEKDAASERLVLDNLLKPLYTELRSINDGEGSTQADVDHANKLSKKIRTLQEGYCKKFSPRMADFIKEAKRALEEALPDYDRQEALQFQVTSAQTGTEIKPLSTGIYSKQAVSLYLNYLEGAFKYRLY